ncbi:MAG: hypothetical protein JNM40_01385 [Myxococcales bacterium]|nr:hypothetical protein [Myxococcales bacterium]
MKLTLSSLSSVCLLSVLAICGCKDESTPGTDVADLAAPEADMTVLPDLTDPPDLTMLPPDLTPACGFGQTFSGGSCTCDATHPVSCAGATHCCAATQACLTPGPRGETRCSLPAQGRARHAMAYDKLRDRSVTRGGVCAMSGIDVLCQDQWQLTPATWDQQTVTNPPAARYDSTFIWDDNAKGLLLFGGLTILNNTNSQTNELWLWDGSTWTKKAPTASPSGRYAHAMAFDSLRKVAVLFGGIPVGGNAVGDTWEWNNSQWIQRTTATVPNVRSDHRMVYDTKDKRILMHGGFVAGQYSRETWSYDGSNWTQLPEDTAVPRRVKFGMAYDENRQVTVVFGGEILNGAIAQLTNDTWEFDGTKWTKKTPGTPPGNRVFPAMFYDAGRKQVLLFGGDPINADQTKDMWAWDGTNWTQLY